MKLGVGTVGCVVLAAACTASGTGTTVPVTGAPAPTAAAASPTPVTTESTPAATSPVVIDGTFDVGGHDLYLRCVGSGTPTIVYFHGAIDDASIDPHQNGLAIQSRLSSDHRSCVYDRRNLGHSESVDAPQRPDDALDDLRGLLAAAGVEPPYVLLGASFGGLLSYLYANRYPDEVTGMVLLDAMIPDELALDELFPADQRFEAFDVEDETTGLERISHYRVLKAASEYIGKEPKIPVIYLAASQEPWDKNDYGVPAYDEQILDVQAACVDRFSPGKLIWVDAPHFMETTVPSEIAEAVREVIALAGP